MSSTSDRSTSGADLTALAAAFPKVELHCHLEGAIRGESLLRIVDEFDLDVPISTPEQLTAAVETTQAQRSLASWRPLFNTLRQAFRSPDLISELTVEVVEDYAAQNAHHVELRFSPFMMERSNGIATADAIRAVEAGISEARARLGISVTGIALITRDATDSDDATRLATETAVAAERGLITGFDIAGQEIGNPASRFAAALDVARASGLGITIHAGEECGPESIHDAIESGAQRLGHALSLPQDPELRDRLTDRGVTLEMCPTSNLLTGNHPDLTSHPAADLLRSGAAVTLNADDPLVCGNDLTEEYRIGLVELGLTRDEMARVVLNAVDGAFLPEDERAAVRTSVEGALTTTHQSQGDPS